MTLLEVVIASALGLIVFGVIVGLMIVSLHVQSTSNSQAVATQMGTDMMQKITRDIRQASLATIQTTPGTTATTCSVAGSAVCGGRLVLTTLVPTAGGPSSSTQVVYDCTSGTCKRTIGSGSAQPLLDQRITITDTSTVFRASASSPPFVGIVLDQKLVSSLSTPYELQGGVALRNSSSSLAGP